MISKKPNWLLLIIVIVTFFINSGCSKKNSTEPEPVTVSDLLPKNNEISGWQRGGDSWNANSSSELNNYINGEEPLYTRHGFVEASMQKYEGTVPGVSGNVTVELRIFDQAKTENAAALLNEIVLQLINPIDWSEGAGQAAKIERFAITQKIIFYRSEYFVSLTITSGLDEALEVLKTFANNVDAKIN
jgi:hypothetical protein